jgi:16S rRNA (adenine1518-N6/adenine1519-N6)-dimethyltransferase
MNQVVGPPNVKALLRRYGLRPDKSLGQNFLVDQGELKKIISTSGLTGDETVIEIGAGLGSLTYHLSRATNRVIAIEFDERLIPALESFFQYSENVELVVGDILQLDLSALVGDGSYQIIANIPYNITSLLIRRLLETSNPPSMVVLTIQREVAERIIASPGQLSLLALSVQVYGVPIIKGHIPAKAFYPSPKVDSAILRIDLHDMPLVPPSLIPTFFQLAKVAFNQKRKQLGNSISGGLGVPKDLVMDWLTASSIDPKKRPQELDFEAWVRLAEIVKERG